MRAMLVLLALIASLTAFAPVATAQQTTTNPDGSVTTTNPDGSSETSFPDAPVATIKGSRTVEFTSGEDFSGGNDAASQDESGQADRDTPGGSSGQFPHRRGFGYTIGGANPIVNLDQTDPDWANKPFGGKRGAKPMRSTACGACAVGMAVSTLTGNRRYTCWYMAKKYKVVMQGSVSWYTRGTDYIKKAGRDAGLRVYAVGTNLELARKAVQKGGLAVVVFAPGHFTRGGHYLLMRAVSDRGFYFADPWKRGQFGHNNEKNPFSAKFLRSQGLYRIWIFQRRS